MFNERKDSKEDAERELLFQKRLAELGFQRQQLPWNMSEAPVFEIPKDESKLFSERDLEEANLSDEEIERRAIMDFLSQTYNFRTFYKRLHYELKRAQRYKRDLCVALVGIDGLELVTREYGTDAADALVKSAARLLLTSIRDVDLAGRCRDDTFGVILPETGDSGAEVAAERMRTRMEKHTITHNWQKLSMTVSVGVACFPGSARGVDEFFAQAAEAMMATMKGGGNGIFFGSRTQKA